MITHCTFSSAVRSFLLTFFRFNNVNIFINPLMLLYRNTQDWVIYKEKKFIFSPFSSLANPSSNDQHVQFSGKGFSLHLKLCLIAGPSRGEECCILRRQKVKQKKKRWMLHKASLIRALTPFIREDEKRFNFTRQHQFSKVVILMQLPSVIHVKSNWATAS